MSSNQLNFTQRILLAGMVLWLVLLIAWPSKTRTQYDTELLASPESDNWFPSTDLTPLVNSSNIQPTKEAPKDVPKNTVPLPPVHPPPVNPRKGQIHNVVRLAPPPRREGACLITPMTVPNCTKGPHCNINNDMWKEVKSCPGRDFHCTPLPRVSDEQIAPHDEKLHPHDIVVAVITSANTGPWRMPDIFATWYRKGIDIIITGKPIPGLEDAPDVFIAPDSQADDWLSCVPKSYHGLRILYEVYPNKKWYITINDDNYINVNRLAEILNRYDPNAPWLMGQVRDKSCGSPCLTSLYGGAAQIFSRPMADYLSQLVPDWLPTRALKLANQWHDCMYGDIAAIGNFQLRDPGGLYSQPPLFYLLHRDGSNQDATAQGLASRPACWHYVLKPGYVLYLHKLDVTWQPSLLMKDTDYATGLGEGLASFGVLTCLPDFSLFTKTWGSRVHSIFQVFSVAQCPQSQCHRIDREAYDYGDNQDGNMHFIQPTQHTVRQWLSALLSGHLSTLSAKFLVLVDTRNYPIVENLLPYLKTLDASQHLIVGDPLNQYHPIIISVSLLRALKERCGALLDQPAVKAELDEPMRYVAGLRKLLDLCEKDTSSKGSFKVVTAAYPSDKVFPAPTRWLLTRKDIAKNHVAQVYAGSMDTWETLRAQVLASTQPLSIYLTREWDHYDLDYLLHPTRIFFNGVPVPKQSTA